MNKKTFTFVALVVNAGAEDLKAIAKTSESACTLAKQFLTRVLNGRKPEQVTPAERHAFMKACIESVHAGNPEHVKAFKHKLFRCGIISTVAKDMGFPVDAGKAGKTGNGKGELSPETFKATAILRSTVKGLAKKGISEADIMAAVKLALAK